MSVAGLCAVCSVGAVVGGCDRCGALACARHYDRPSGLCTDCLERGDRRPAGERPDGVGEYRF